MRSGRQVERLLRALPLRGHPLAVRADPPMQRDRRMRWGRRDAEDRSAAEETAACEGRLDALATGGDPGIAVRYGGEIAPGFAGRMMRQRRGIVGPDDEGRARSPRPAVVAGCIDLEKHLKS